MHTKGKLTIEQHGTALWALTDSGDTLKTSGIAWETGDEPNANTRRIVALWNLFDGIPTEAFEGKALAEYVAGQAYLTGFDDSGIGIKGIGAQVLVSSLAGQFKASGAENYLVIDFYHEETGPCSVTIQRKHGKQLAEELIELRELKCRAIEKGHGIGEND